MALQRIALSLLFRTDGIEKRWDADSPQIASLRRIVVPLYQEPSELGHFVGLQRKQSDGHGPSIKAKNWRSVSTARPEFSQIGVGFGMCEHPIEHSQCGV